MSLQLPPDVRMPQTMSTPLFAIKLDCMRAAVDLLKSNADNGSLAYTTVTPDDVIRTASTLLMWVLSEDELVQMNEANRK